MASEIIDALGGNQAVAGLLKVRAATVSNWRQRGVPWKFRGQLVAIMRRKRLPVPEGFMVP